VYARQGAIEVLTHYLAKELAPRRITANVAALDLSKQTSAAAWCGQSEINKYSRQ